MSTDLQTSTLSPSLNCSVANISGGLALTSVSTHPCLWTVQTLEWQGISTTSIVVVNAISVEGPGAIQIASGTSFVVVGTLTVMEGARLLFSPTDSVQDQGSLSVLAGSSVLLNGSNFALRGGTLGINHGSLLGSGNLTNSTIDTVSRLNVEGMGPGGNLEVNGSSVDWVNLTQANYSLSFVGSYSSLSSVSHVNARNATLLSFDADDAILSSVVIGAASKVTLGDPTATTSDLVQVQGLSILSPITGELTMAHTTVTEFQWSGGASVDLVASTFSGTSNSITDVSGDWTATTGCTFAFPLEFNGSAVVKLVNSSAPSLTVNGRVHAVVYNWNGNTTLGPGRVEQLTTVAVNNQSAYAQVYRYVVIDVLGVGGTLPPNATKVLVSATDVTDAPTTTYTLPTNSETLGIYLPTDNISTGGSDTFTGAYTVQASAKGVTANGSIVILADDQKVDLQLQPNATTSAYPLYELLVEIGLLAAVVAATAYLISRIRRDRPRHGAATKIEEAETTSHPS